MKEKRNIILSREEVAEALTLYFRKHNESWEHNLQRKVEYFQIELALVVNQNPDSDCLVVVFNT